ncbi:glycosyltransferase [Roseobacter weihaiensis]|uniref:glycosyltransferase n=1 Tax=Roseobacter weihaiensis TaxID=2763262 RepID=UPI001D0B72EB|nr:glycosyltransferase [Roseobacter sp. H9]
MNPLLFIVFIGLALHLLGIALLVRRMRPASKSGPKHADSVSIIKPICGVDAGLEENIRSILEVEPIGDHEVLFVAGSLNEPGIQVARSISAEFPDVTTRFLSSSGSEALNPKSANIIEGIAASNFDLIWQTDACIRVQRDSLRVIHSNFLSKESDLLCALPIGVGETNIFAAFHNSYLNTYLIPSIVFLSIVAHHPCTLGKSLFFRRTTFQDLEGEEVIAGFLAEDYLLGQAFSRGHKKVDILPLSSIASINQTLSASSLLSKNLRWLAMRGSISLPALAGDIAFNPFCFAVLAALFQPSLFFNVVPVVYLIKLVLELLGARVLCRPAYRLPHLFLLPMREFIIFGVGLVSVLRRKAVWRGTYFDLGKQSKILNVTRGHSKKELVSRATNNLRK